MMFPFTQHFQPLITGALFIFTAVIENQPETGIDINSVIVVEIMPGLSSGQEERAAKLVSEAEKILSKKGFFSTLLGSSSSQRYEDAADLFRKAATCLKVKMKREPYPLNYTPA